jgi:hypothetical protein
VGLVKVTQLTELVAVHEQLEPVVMEMLPKLPVEGAVMLVGDTLYVHCANAGRASSRQNSANKTPQHRTIIGSPLDEDGYPAGSWTDTPEGAYRGPRLVCVTRCRNAVYVWPCERTPSNL